jgi:integrase
LRIRSKHAYAARPELWLGHGGPMTDSGIYQVVRDRAAAAGLGSIGPHRFGHTFAHAASLPPRALRAIATDPKMRRTEYPVRFAHTKQNGPVGPPSA